MGIFDTLSFFWMLKNEDKNILENFCQVRSLEAWEILFSEGEDANAVYILISWKLRVFRWSEEFQDTIAILQAEDIIGEMWVFSEEKKRNASVIALEAAEVITILDFSIRELTQKYPQIYQKIFEIIDTRALK